MAPFGCLKIPKRLEVELRKFLNSHPEDLVPLNLAPAATIIYFDITRALEERSTEENLPRVPLGAFIIYFPHMLRFVEAHRLSLHIHPLRFAARSYAADIEHDASDFAVLLGDQESDVIKMLVQTIQSKTPDITPTTRLPRIPQSMPGTKLSWPEGIHEFHVPSKELWGLCLLDDINTLGLPMYRTLQDTVRTVAIPACIHSSRPSRLGDLDCLPQFPHADCWVPTTNPPVAVLAGTNQVLGPVFKDVFLASDLPEVDVLLGRDLWRAEDHATPYPMADILSRNLRQLG